jgi:type I restriction enzyme M protein
LTSDDIGIISRTYHSWRGEKEASKYKDFPGFCKSASVKDVEGNGHVLTPGRYVGAEKVEDDGEPFDEKMRLLSAALRNQFAEGREIEKVIETNLKELGYGG